MNLDGKELIFFDIETGGFSAFEDPFVSGAFTNPNRKKIEVVFNLKNLMAKLSNFSAKILVTWNGENWKGGFDFPWLRSYCLKSKIDWQLSGIEHLDLLPLVRKRLNTTSYQPPSSNDFKASDWKRLAKENDIEYQNKSQCQEEMIKLDKAGKADWLDYKYQTKEDNSLQNVYQLLFDSKAKEEYTSGGEMPKFYKQFQNGDLEAKAKIEAHNRRDVERLRKIAHKVIPVLPDWELKRAINQL